MPSIVVPLVVVVSCIVGYLTVTASTFRSNRSKLGRRAKPACSITAAANEATSVTTSTDPRNAS